MASNGRISILIMEDNELTRVAIRGALERVPEFKVVDEAGSGESALEKITAQPPQVVLADIGLPGMNGIETTKRIKERWPQVRVLMLTSSDSDNDIINSFDAGADGYVVKEAFDERLESAVKDVQAGMTWLDPRIAKCVLKVASRSVGNGGGSANHLPEPLSEHETDVLNQVVTEGGSCKDGVCSIDPDFVKKLHRFARGSQTEN